MADLASIFGIGLLVIGLGSLISMLKKGRKPGEAEARDSTTRRGKRSLIQIADAHFGSAEPGQPDVPLAHISRLAEMLGFEISPVTSGLQLSWNAQNYTLEVNPRRRTTRHGHDMLGTVTLRTRRPALPLGSEKRDLFIAAANTMAALGAWMSESDDVCTTYESRVTYYDAHDGSWDLYIPMLLFSAVCEAEVFPAVIRSVANGTRGEQRRALETPFHTPSDFNKAATMLQNAGIVANGGNGLTAEFSWKRGVVSAMEGKGMHTSLLTLTTAEAHPDIGTGTLCKLQLPMSFGPHEAPRLANFLNRQEASAEDAPPFVGAWCSQPGTGDVVFVSFVPNAVCRSVHPTSIAAWMCFRSELAAQWIAAWRETAPLYRSPVVRS